MAMTSDASRALFRFPAAFALLLALRLSPARR
jgi:hypothetical protein